MTNTMRLVSLLVVVIGLVVCSTTAAAASKQAAGQARVSAVCDTGKVHFAKTKFLFHMGLAFGAFHRYIYKPVASGAFNSGASGRIKAGISKS